MASFLNLERLGIRGKISVLSMAPNDFRSVFYAIDQSNPDEIYYLSGQSSVGLSFEQPAETLESVTSGVLNVLEVVRLRRKAVKLYNASSSECFGETDKQGADEQTPFRPRSPYAVAKASAHWLVVNYREAYDIFACSGLLFNHESPLRPPRFVTQKIIAAAERISHGSREKLQLGNLDISRDWGWAPEYVEAMWLMLQQEVPDDFVIATGKANTLKDFVAMAFEIRGLDWRNHVEINPALFRPSDLNYSIGNTERATERLGWRASKGMRDVIAGMST